MLLAVDTSTQILGLALYDGIRVRGEMVWESHNHHTIELAPSIGELMSRCGVKSTDLKCLAVALGPGSFTSLRVGLAVVKGMAFGLHLPVVGIPTLDVLAAGQPLQNVPMAAGLQAGRGRLAVGWYENKGGGWVCNDPPAVMNAEKLAAQIKQPTYICGEMFESDRATLARRWKNALLATPANCVRRPGFLAELAWQRWQAGQEDGVAALEPIYLHLAEGIDA